MHKLNYPYIKDKKTLDTQAQIKLKKYLDSIHKPLIKNKYSSVHGIYAPKLIKRIDDLRKTYPYFLKFDIAKFFVNIDHTVLRQTIDDLMQVSSKTVGKKGDYYLQVLLPKFLKTSPFDGVNIPTGSTLSHTLCSIYLAKLDMAIKVPFVRFVDDYLLVFKNHHQIDEFVESCLLPILAKLKIRLNPEKLTSGKFSQQAVEYLGFKLTKGIITISDGAVESFKRKIKKTTKIQQLETKQVIEQLNYKIDGFGHYYKTARCVTVYAELDKFVRMRLRRYCHTLPDKTSHFLLTNADLDKVGLHQLSLILSDKVQNKFKHNKPKSDLLSFSNSLNAIEQRLGRIENLLVKLAS